jgi:prepilin signal peptidase PulO-like enzyme (type II secretory pathway)
MIDQYILYFLIFAVGTVFGSFLNLVSDRIVSGESIMFGRSVCDFCRNPLNPKSLVPLFSFIFQKGKSACCKKDLSWAYPVSEFMTGIAFLFAAHYSRVLTEFSLSSVLVCLYLATVFSFFIILFFTDAKYRLLPDKIVYTAIYVTLVFILGLYLLDLKMYHDKLLAGSFGQYLIQAGFWKNHLFLVFKQILVLIASSFFISFFFMSLIMITKGRGMGGGDVKLGFLIGLFNGFPGNILAIFLGFLFGSIYSLGLIALKKKGVKDTIAFGPFLILGSVVAFIWGDAFIRWYLGFM